MLNVCVRRQSEKVSVEPAGRHKRGATGRDQILIDTENILSLTGALHLTQPCPFHTLVTVRGLVHMCARACVCVCVYQVSLL